MSEPASRPIRLEDLSLVCYDFDGVMTDNRALVTEDGREAVFVNRADGLAVAALKRLGVRQVILSTETNAVVAARGRKLGIPVVQSLENKETALRDYARAEGADLAGTAYLGNDINDLAAMRLARYAVAPADAHPSVKAIAAFVTRAKGGEGVVREFLDLIQGTEGAV